MKVYVAAQFGDKERAKYAIKLLTKLGHTITHDWTNEDDTGMDPETKARYWGHCGLRDLAGARDCDLFFLLAHARGVGSMTEFGIALAMNRPVVVVKPEEIRNIFFTLPWVKKVETIEEGLDYVQELAGDPAFKPPGPSIHFGPLTLPSTIEVLLEVVWERVAQDKKWGEQNWPDGTGGFGYQQLRDHHKAECEKAAKSGFLTFAHISQEEHYEALAEADELKLERELLQDAAVKIEWIEAIRRRRMKRKTEVPRAEASGNNPQDQG